MIVAVVFMRMMQTSVDEVISVVAMRNGLMTATRTVPVR
jgi:hypothetical protein